MKTSSNLGPLAKKLKKTIRNTTIRGIFLKMNCGILHGKHSWRDLSLRKCTIEEFDRGWFGIAIIFKVETFLNEFASLFSNKQEMMNKDCGVKNEELWGEELWGEELWNQELWGEELWDEELWDCCE